MVVEINVYKRFDTDLIALCDAGFPVPDMMRNAIVAYANGMPLRYTTGAPLFFDMNNKKSVRFRISVNDSKSVELLKSIKHRLRNAFCKCVLRNALIQQNTSAFLSTSNHLDLQKTDYYYKCNNNEIITVLPKQKQPLKNILGKTIMDEESGKDVAATLPPQTDTVSISGTSILELTDIPKTKQPLASTVKNTEETDVPRTTVPPTAAAAIIESSESDDDEDDAFLAMFDNL